MSVFTTRTPRTPRKASVRSSRLRRLIAKAKAGMTLIEIMIVVAIIAMIAGGVTFAFRQQRKAQIRTTQTNARGIRSVAQAYYNEHREACPTVQGLITAGEIDTHGKTTDEFGKPFQIQCTGEDLEVISGGPDGTIGNGDDITTAATPTAGG